MSAAGSNGASSGAASAPHGSAPAAADPGAYDRELAAADDSGKAEKKGGKARIPAKAPKKVLSPFETSLLAQMESINARLGQLEQKDDNDNKAAGAGSKKRKLGDEPHMHLLGFLLQEYGMKLRLVTQELLVQSFEDALEVVAENKDHVATSARRVPTGACYRNGEPILDFHYKTADLRALMPEFDEFIVNTVAGDDVTQELIDRKRQKARTNTKKQKTDDA